MLPFINKQLSPRTFGNFVDKFKTEQVLNFSVEFFRRCHGKDTVSNRNILCSPFSALCALGMALNGANGATESEIEKVIGISTEEINQYISAYMETIKQEDCRLKCANLVYLNADINMKARKDFFKICKNLYSSDIVKESFSMEAVNKINNWACQQTDGMIRNILDSYDKDDLLYLMNALAFTDKWMYPFSMCEKEGTFTCQNGKKKRITMMRSEESVYLKDICATGFMKQYRNPQVCFVALLPDENLNVVDYVKNLSGDKIKKILEKAEEAKVHTIMPIFLGKNKLDVKDVLENMGIRNAFSRKADFSKIGELQGKDAKKKINISEIVQECYISVDKEGTKAAAITTITMSVIGCLSTNMPKVVVLNRPFVYMIFDKEKMLPLFMGTVMEV